MDPVVVAQGLESAGATNVAAYHSKLTNNALVREVLRDLLAEANAALMFRSYGIAVEMGESPDLTLEVSGQTVCAEVKHFRRKLQDNEDEKRLAKYGGLLVEYGDTIPTEGTSAWDQVVAVARRKTKQYRPGVPNILVLDSSSPHSVDDLEVLTARNIIDDMIASGADARLSRLNGILLMAREFSLFTRRNVYFFELQATSTRLAEAAALEIHAIKKWRRGLTSA